ncbi:acetylornithine deacetylase [Acuticoccus sp. MNP-M23]|uniref:acetylornithine deacetylase n=1 Tax=Acuticoccus sp. MNP-M23 TaxID=3072793 RepID=UPI00281643CD|nr:acetylornithine deacetylase [Acuticoccus sp. MNP-M23]WMS40752.1 acetylornithine deacetylase [Acuticoccus sp. MNP-M23]
MSRSTEILSELIAMPTVSRTPNTALLDRAAELLAAAGATLTRVPYENGRENLYAVIGPADRPAVILSGHTDVVPVEGQAWTKPPFELTREDGRLYGRGTADMKGFVAAAMAAAERAKGRTLKNPLALALSCDEEVGCLGVRPLIEMLKGAPVRPGLVIVGEPTQLAVATGHKGKTSLTAVFRGREGHSALAPLAFNALHLATDFVAALRTRQAEFAERGFRDGDYDVPYTTVHVGTLKGGVALNIVPNHAVMEFEVRALAEDDDVGIIEAIRADAAAIVAAAGDPDASIEITEGNRSPGLATAKTDAAVDFVKRLTGANGTIKVAYATEGGLFAEGLGAPVVVCGPGSMAQGHRPDEFITEDDLARCDTMLDALLERLEAGL